MGCFNLKGYLSNATISYGDEIVLMIGLVKRKCTAKYYTLSNIVPVTLPIYGKYNDYGGIEEIEDTPSKDYIEKNYGTIEHVIEAIYECMTPHYKGIDSLIKSDNEYHPELCVRYVYNNIPIRLRSSDYAFCVLAEHREVYETWISDDTMYDINDALNTNNWEWRYFLERCFYNQSEFILCFHDQNFLRDNIEEVIKLQKHIEFMIEHDKELSLPIQYSQSHFFKEEIEFHKMVIKLNKSLLKKRKDAGYDYE